MKMKVVSYVLLILFFSCGKSPSENHSYESKKTEEIATQKSSEFKSINLFLSLEWLQGPYGDPAQESQFLMVVKNAQGQSADLPQGYELNVTGIMPSMGHGTDWDGENERLERGLYFHKELYFNMPGDWVLYIDLVREEEVIETITYFYNL